MAVHSNTFGGVQLSGKDAETFRKQARARTSLTAKKTAANGIIAARKLISSGQVKVSEAA